MLYPVLVVLVVLWLIGAMFQFGGNAIHAVLVLAGIIWFIDNIKKSRDRRGY